MARRAGSWSTLYFVGSRHGERSALNRQCRGDHLGCDAGRTLSVTHASQRKRDERSKDE